MEQKKIQYFSDSYIVIEKIGGGSFGEVWLATDYQNKLYAVKVEENTKQKSKLELEFNIYRTLFKNGFNQGLPCIYDFVKAPMHNFLVMQLLGVSLDALFVKLNKKFNLGTVLKLGFVITTLLERMHNAKFVHRDIKPNNFLIGYGEERDTLYIMDFGLSKQYVNDEGVHLRMRTDHSLIGTARYAGINIHHGIEPSRRDDLESVGYMLVYFAKGILPWQGLGKVKGKTQFEVIGEKKMSVTTKQLCRGLPQCFAKYIDYCRKLEYQEKPDYKYLRSLFVDCSTKKNIKMVYEWQ